MGHLTSPLPHQDMTSAHPPPPPTPRICSLPQNVPRAGSIAKETIQRVAIQFQRGPACQHPAPEKAETVASKASLKWLGTAAPSPETHAQPYLCGGRQVRMETHTS